MPINRFYTKRLSSDRGLTIDIWLHGRDAFEESKHPRGQPENKGEFAKGSGAASSSSRKLIEGESNQLDKNEQEIGHARLAKLFSSKNSNYGKAYNLESVDLNDLGMDTTPWHMQGTHPAGAGMNSEKFSRVMAVPLRGIGASEQDATSRIGLSSYIVRMPDPKKDGYPEVAVTPDGKYHLLSGHTRAGAAMLGGRSHLVARVYRFDQNNHWVREKPSIPTKMK